MRVCVCVWVCVLQLSTHTITVATLLGYSSGNRVNIAVINIADPTPSVILKSTQKIMKIHPEGIIATNLYESKTHEGGRERERLEHVLQSLHINVAYPMSRNAPPTRKRPAIIKNLSPN